MIKLHSKNVFPPIELNKYLSESYQYFAEIYEKLKISLRLYIITNSWIAFTPWWYVFVNIFMANEPGDVNETA